MTRDHVPFPEANVGPAAPVLNYATRAANGLPDWVPEAEELISAGAPPDSIRPFFRKADEAAGYYAKSQERRFGRDALTGQCIGCEIETRYACAVHWQVMIKPRTLEFRATSPVTWDCVTYHSVCVECFARWLSRAVKLAKPTVAVSWTIISFFLLFVFAVAMLRLTRLPVAPWVVLALVGAFVVLVVAELVLRKLAIGRAPDKLKGVMPRKGVALMGPGHLFEATEAGLKEVESLPGE